MANYLKYSDIPVFGNFTQENTSPLNAVATHMFATSDASLNLDANVTPIRYLGGKKATMPASGPLEGKFSFTFYPMIESSNANEKLNIQKINQLKFFDLTGDFAFGHSIYMSNFLLKRTYLQSYSIKINPYQPISVSANMISYDITNIEYASLTGQSFVPSITKDPTKPNYEALHGLTASLSPNIKYNLPESKTSIEVNVDCQRTPVYTIGSRLPDKVVLTSVERTVTVQGENIGQIMSITGSEASDLNLFLLPLSQIGTTPNANTAKNFLSFNINGTVVSQQLSVSQNSMLNGRVIIKEIVF